MICRGEIRPLKKEDLQSLLIESMHEEDRLWMDEGMMNMLISQPFSVSIFYKDRLMLSGGVIGYWFNRAQVWTFFSEKSKDNFISAFRAIKRFLDYQPFNRVELSVPVNFEQGKRRALLLGFNLECESAKSYLPDGTDCALFSFIKGDKWQKQQS